MAARPMATSSRKLIRGFSGLIAQDPLVQCLSPTLSRSLATAAATTPSSPLTSPVLATVFHFPSLEPSRFVEYSADQLQLPLRRDLLHRAVIYEGDRTRQGTASTKDRSEVRGSTRKIRPQKGTGRARLGDKKSPMLVGGGVAHGPKPRDFSTQLPRKIYDLAWRTALSYRYKKGELLLLEDDIDVDEIGLAHEVRLKRILDKLHLGRTYGGSMFVLSEDYPEQITALSNLGLSGKLRASDEVDVKNLLTKGHLLIQKRALDHILEMHSSDLSRSVPKATLDGTFRSASRAPVNKFHRRAEIRQDFLLYRTPHSDVESLLCSIDVHPVILSFKCTAELVLAVESGCDAITSKNTARCVRLCLHGTDAPLYFPTTELTRLKKSNSAQSGVPKELPGDDPEDVLFGSQYAARTIELNRPKKLNSLDGSMIRKMLPRLKEWEKSDLASVVIIAGAGEKAFCAGGDVATLAKYNKEGPDGQKRSADYFALEYALDHLIATYPKPYVAYMDGITMGGGVGLSVHAPFRIATERTVFAMPETRIGFFPDVGGGFFLPRLDGFIGRYLALTSEQLKGVNAFYAGIATHYIHSSTLGDLTSRLGELTFKDYVPFEERLQAVNTTIEEYNSGLPHDESMLLAGELRQAIDKCFAPSTVEEILAQLELCSKEAESEALQAWATKTIATIKDRSPTSLKATLRQMIIGKQWSIKQAFLNEHALAANFMKHPDFTEGVEARLMKPTRTPKWQPENIEDVTNDHIDALFQPQGAQIKLFTEGNYTEYPWQFGLPRERAILDHFKRSNDRKETIEHFVFQTQGKVGVREKVNEVLSRH